MGKLDMVSGPPNRKKICDIRSEVTLEQHAAGGWPGKSVRFAVTIGVIAILVSIIHGFYLCFFQQKI